MPPENAALPSLKVTVPLDYKPRWYQSELWEVMFDLDNPESLETPIKRAFRLHHRRAGKDLDVFNISMVKLSHRVGLYAHIFPTLAEGRKVIWEGANRDGRKFLDYVPGHAEFLDGDNEGWVRRKRDDHMSIDFANGSRYQVLGADHPNSARGMNIMGAVFSEYGFFKSSEMFTIIRPMLKENGGWAVFVTTPNGRNHSYLQHRRAENDPNWFVDVKTVADTGVVTEEQVEEERRDGMSEEDIQREYYCSYDGAVSGTFYGRQIDKAKKDGRVCKLPYDSRYKVNTWWDIGVRDGCAIWFVQELPGKVHVIDFEFVAGWGFNQYAKMLEGKPVDDEILGPWRSEYHYGLHIAPHDITVREVGADFAETRMGSAARHGINFNAVPKGDIDDGRNAVRGLLGTCLFDARRTEVGLAGLQDYAKKPLENVHDPDGKQLYTNEHIHNWASHPADAFRTGAVGRTLFSEDDDDVETPAPKIAIV